MVWMLFCIVCGIVDLGDFGVLALGLFNSVLLCLLGLLVFDCAVFWCVLLVWGWFSGALVVVVVLVWLTWFLWLLYYVVLGLPSLWWFSWFRLVVFSFFCLVVFQGWWLWVCAYYNMVYGFWFGCCLIRFGSAIVWNLRVRVGCLTVVRLGVLGYWFGGFPC